MFVQACEKKNDEYGSRFYRTNAVLITVNTLNAFMKRYFLNTRNGESTLSIGDVILSYEIQHR
jgi:hypothetical protein